MMTPRQCEIAAESFVASMLAQSGYDVLVQYGANQPDYDIVAVKDKRILLVSVKGSQRGGWMLASRYVTRGVNYHEAIDQWLENQREDLVFILVEYKDVLLGQAPRAYIARPKEIAKQLAEQRNGQGHGALLEDWQRDHPRAQYNDRIPGSWVFTQSRIDTI